jgi:riboflavin kinase/FMN adenylyltransferase
MAAEEFLPHLRIGCLPQLAGVYVGDNWRFGRGRTRRQRAAGPRIGQKLGWPWVFSVPRVTGSGATDQQHADSRAAYGRRDERGERTAGLCLFCRWDDRAGQATGAHHWVSDAESRLGARSFAPRHGVYTVRVIGRKSAASCRVWPTTGCGRRWSGRPSRVWKCTYSGTVPTANRRRVKIEWLRFIRPEMKFAGVAELRAQIAGDRNEALADFSLR